MFRITVVVREVGKLKPDYSLDFEVPQIPAVGDYISMQRPDAPEPYGEDLIVRRVWWRLSHPETRMIVTNKPKTGSVKEIFVECDPAIGPYSSDRWRDNLRLYTGVSIPELEVDRYSVRQDFLNKTEDS